MSNLDTYIETCERAVRAAGATIRQWVGRTNTQCKGPADFVTEADYAAQEVVKSTVLQAFPHHSVLGEEDQIAGNTPSETEYRWIVDPLDGTDELRPRYSPLCGVIGPRTNGSGSGRGYI